MQIVIGIDEVGRGPIAGPVCVCAFKAKRIPALPKSQKLPLRDSKKLTRAQRELWYAQIKIWQKEGKCDFAVTMISAKMIDKIGISKAINRALIRSLKNLQKSNVTLLSDRRKSLLFLDGGLYAPAHFKNQKTIIKGDEKVTVISLASIVAKVTRDRHMYRHAKKMPEYGFEQHVGYGTRAHYLAIKKHGLSDLHRRSFLKNL